MGQTRRQPQRMRPGCGSWLLPSLVAVLALRSCVRVGAAASTSWPSKVHGSAAVDAEREKEPTLASPSRHGASEAVPEKPKVQLGLPGRRKVMRIAELLVPPTPIVSSPRKKGWWCSFWLSPKNASFRLSSVYSLVRRIGILPFTVSLD